MKAKLPKPKEGTLTKPILDYLAMRGIMAWRNNSGARVFAYTSKRTGKTSNQFFRWGGLPGASDIFAILGPTGRFLAIETKRAGEKPTDAQEAFLQAVEAAGGLGIVAWTLDDVHEAIEGAK